jgi:hypothetical protein
MGFVQYSFSHPDRFVGAHEILRLGWRAAITLRTNCAPMHSVCDTSWSRSTCPAI